MKSIGKAVGQEIQVELKYCERCGGLWLRPRGRDGVYCANCRARLQARVNVEYSRSHPCPQSRSEEVTNLVKNRHSLSWIHNLRGMAMQGEI